MAGGLYQQSATFVEALRFVQQRMEAYERKADENARKQ